MLGNFGANHFNFIFSNSAAPGNAAGGSITPGASNVEGTFAALITSGNITQDIWAFTMWVQSGATSGQSKPMLMDIGVDPAGGTSFTAVISDIVCGNADSAANSQGQFFVFPFSVKAGSAIAIRIQGANGTAGTVRVVMKLYGQPSHPQLVRTGQYSETVGAITNSNGVSFTPVSGAKSSWELLGTTTRACWFWQLCIQCDNAAQSDLAYYFDLGYGDGTTGGTLTIIDDLSVRTVTAEAQRVIGGAHLINAYCEVPAGASLYVRGRASATPDSGWNATAVGIGG